jgi:hypothetical protein
MPRKCSYEGCPNEPAYPGQFRCEAHTLRWLPGKPVEREPELPEWRRRDLRKDFSGRAA